MFLVFSSLIFTTHEIFSQSMEIGVDGETTEVAAKAAMMAQCTATGPATILAPNGEARHVQVPAAKVQGAIPDLAVSHEADYYWGSGSHHSYFSDCTHQHRDISGSNAETHWHVSSWSACQDICKARSW